MYRINFGNGQVSHTFTQKKNAVRELSHLQTLDGFAFSYVQRYEGGGEWVRVDVRR